MAKPPPLPRLTPLFIAACSLDTFVHNFVHTFVHPVVHHLQARIAQSQNHNSLGLIVKLLYLLVAR